MALWYRHPVTADASIERPGDEAEARTYTADASRDVDVVRPTLSKTASTATIVPGQAGTWTVAGRLVWEYMLLWDDAMEPQALSATALAKTAATGRRRDRVGGRVMAVLFLVRG